MDPSGEDKREESIPVDTNALNLRWSFGFNSSVPGAVHNLSTPKRNAVFYVSAHTGVIHDTDQDMQYLLQGHCNPITAVCVSKDRRWIATADSGEEAMIVVWDAQTASPVKIINQPYDNGIAAMDMSSDAMFLVTLSAGSPQQVAIWEWTVATQEPAIIADVGDHEYQHCVRFNPVDVRDIVSNGTKEAIFWNWTEEALTPFHPPKGIRKLKKNVGALTQTVFIPYTTKAVTATVSGNVVLWDYPVSELVQSSGRDAVKILKLVNRTGINLMDTVLDRYVVCGCMDGAVRFFDFQFRVVAWFEDVQAGQITSISFAESSVPQSAPSTAGNVSMDEFQVPDFIVSTSEGKIIRLESRMMDHINEEKRRGALLVQGFDDDVYALDAHPSLPVFAIGTLSGTLQIWDIDDRVINATRKFEPEKDTKKNKDDDDERASEEDRKKDGADGKAAGQQPGTVNNSNVISHIKFGPNGQVMAVGFANGTLRILSASEASSGSLSVAGGQAANSQPPLRDIKVFHHSTETITDISFSADGSYLATADGDRCVALYRYYHKDEETDKPMDWIFIGKFRAHYKPISSIYFSVPLPRPPKDEDEVDDTGAQADLHADAPRLFSLGEDRILHEYDIGRSSIRAGLKLKNSTKTDQVATPTAFVSIPSRPVVKDVDLEEDPEAAEDDEDRNIQYTPDLLVTANDEYKLKVWDLSSGLPDVDYYADYNNTYQDGGNDDMHGHSLREVNQKVCCKTLLAPTYGGPLNKLFVLPKRAGTRIVPSQFLVYSTYKKVVGLIKLPLDGNPNKAMALIAHPNEISCIACSFDGKYLITAGGKDRSVNLWSVSTDALEASIALAGNGIQPYMGLLEGGQNGEFYQDLLDYFYYAQLCSQGVMTTAPREITGFIPIDQVVNLMRALGYYPTQHEVMDIRNEIKFAHQSQISSFKDQVDLEEFIKLYVNYRPVFGLGKKQFRAAFRTLRKQMAHPDTTTTTTTTTATTTTAAAAGDMANTNASIATVYLDEEGLEAQPDQDPLVDLGEADEALSLERNELLEKLVNLGEQMSVGEIAGVFKTLLGKDLPDGYDPETVLAALTSETYTPNLFADQVLGFQDYQA